MSIKILITAQELIAKGLWDKVSEMKRYHPWIFAEGRADPETFEVELTLDEAHELGLIK